MTSRFFAGGESSSSSSSSSESSDDEKVQVQQAAVGGRKPMARWAEQESSSDDDDAPKRVVRSQSDKRYDQLNEQLKQLKNHVKNNDFAEIITDYEGAFKCLDKMKSLIEQDGGPPNRFIKAIADLEIYVETLHKDNIKKTLNQNKARAFNTLRAKIRSGNKQPLVEDLIMKYKEDPSAFAEEEVPEAEESSDSSSESGDDKSSGSDSGSSDSSGSSSSSDSGSDSDSSSSGSSSSSSKSGKSGKSVSDSDSDPDADEEAAREKKMMRWVITPEEQAKRDRKAAAAAKKEEEAKAKAAKSKQPRQTKNKDGKDDKDGETKKEKEEYTAEEVEKKVMEILQSRGRKGFDRAQYMEKLESMIKHAVEHGPLLQLFIISSQILADFDNTGGAFQAMKLELWVHAIDLVNNRMFPLIVESHAEFKRDGGDDSSFAPTAEGDEEVALSHRRQQELFVSFIRQLDDELYKALQFTVDVYGPEYQEILSNCAKYIKLVKRALTFFEETNQPGPRGLVAMRLMEQVYYKPDILNKAVFEAIKHSVPEEEKSEWDWPQNSCAYITKLVKYIGAVKEPGMQKKAALCQAYHLALHDQFQVARDLLHLGNLQDQAAEADVHTQIIYNRVLAQMGLCAFRLGKIQEAHNFLMDVCMHNKARELLAQGLSFRFQERTPEQERAERLRQLPYHMHINLEVLESAHYICAMLLEVPNLAQAALDPSNKRIVSRVLRRQLEQSDRQIFAGPPENAREAVVSAAKALQRGDWQTSMLALEELKLWDHVDPGSAEAGKAIRDMIKVKVKTEALRTYLFAYGSIYDAFQLDQLVLMFELDAKEVHSIVSKMMLKEEITAFWDESSKFVLVQHSEPSALQRLCLKLSENVVISVETNEKLVDAKIGGYGLKDQPRQGGFGGGKGGKGGKGRFGAGMAPVFEDGKGGRKGGAKGSGKGNTGGNRRAADLGWGNARTAVAMGGAARGTGGGGSGWGSGGARSWGDVRGGGAERR